MEALGRLEDWGLAGSRAGQYRCDLAADEAAVPLLLESGLGVCSEESGMHSADRDVVVVLDPVDGSTNAALGHPWYSISLCAVDSGGALAALVQNLATGLRYTAVRGAGAYRDGVPIRPSTQTELPRAVVGISGYPPSIPGWWQFRARGSSALDLCTVADGGLDGFLDYHAHRPWDYMGAMLVCEQSGAVICDILGRELTVVDPLERRTLLAACTPGLAEALMSCADLRSPQDDPASADEDAE